MTVATSDKVLSLRELEMAVQFEALLLSVLHNGNNSQFGCHELEIILPELSQIAKSNRIIRYFNTLF